MDDTEDVEMLVKRRSKRSTAGNRMEAALAEMALEDLTKDLDDDKDFVNDKVEEDVFGSDFESTDEEAENNAQDVGEKEIIHEERRVKKAARSRLEKVTAAAHAKHKSSFNAEIQINLTTKNKVPKPQHIPLRTESADAGTRVIDERIRTSKRMHTVLSTSATVERLKQVEARRASLPKKAKIETKRYTQAELIALALDTEEGNIVEHRDYLKNEAEKRKRARVLRTAVTGPLLRWTSRLEQVKISVTPPPPPPPPLPPVSSPPSTAYRGVYGPPGSLFTPTTYSYPGGATAVSVAALTSGSTSQQGIVQPTPSQPSTTTFLSYPHYMDPSLSPFPTWPVPNHQSYYSPVIFKPIASTSATQAIASTSSASTTPGAIPMPGTSIATPAAAGSTLTSTVPVNSTITTVPTKPTVVEMQATPIASENSVTSAALPSTTDAPDDPTPTVAPTPAVTPILVPAVSIPSTSQTSTTLLETSGSAPEPVDNGSGSPPETEYREETVTKNYLIHELDQQKDAPKASWADTMQVMFGNHVKWNEMKVFVGKGRPLSRPRQTCLITGRQAHYFDPRTGVPYADSYAYKALTGLLRHEYIWNPSLGCYVDHGDTPDLVRSKEANSAITVDDAMDEN